MRPGRIILLNGASSAGKSTLARALQAQLESPFWHWSIDHLFASGTLPRERLASGEFDWQAMRPAFFEGFHRSLPVLAAGGNDLIVEHIVETADWMRLLVELLAPFDVFYVGVRCPLPELERRELARGDRRVGSAREDDASTHGLGEYDVEVDSTSAPPEQLAADVLRAWRARRAPGAFARMAAREG
jgi:chloramphenicol 3-O phosphotransferase